MEQVAESAPMRVHENPIEACFERVEAVLTGDLKLAFSLARELIWRRADAERELVSSNTESLSAISSEALQELTEIREKNGNLLADLATRDGRIFSLTEQLAAVNDQLRFANAELADLQANPDKDFLEWVASGAKHPVGSLGKVHRQRLLALADQHRESTEANDIRVSMDPRAAKVVTPKIEPKAPEQAWKPAVEGVPTEEPINRVYIESLVGTVPRSSMPDVVVKAIPIYAEPGQRTLTQIAAELGVKPAAASPIRRHYDRFIINYSVLARPEAKAYFLEVFEKRLKAASA